MPDALAFSIDFNGTPLNFVLPSKHDGVLRVMKADKKIPNTSKNMDQALRTSWRILKDWVEAQLAIVEADLAPIQEVFIQYLILNSSGQTLSQKILQGNGIKLLDN